MASKTTTTVTPTPEASSYQGVQLASDEELTAGLTAILTEKGPIGPSPARTQFRIQFSRACSYNRLKEVFLPLREAMYPGQSATRKSNGEKASKVSAAEKRVAALNEAMKVARAAKNAVTVKTPQPEVTPILKKRAPRKGAAVKGSSPVPARKSRKAF
jgi:hypothetical protein